MPEACGKVEAMDRSSARAPTLPILFALFVALLLAAYAPGDADAITKQRAERIAVQKLKAKKAKQPLVVFGLGKSLPARSVVTEAVRRKGTPRGDGRAVGRRFWLFWADLRPQAHFMHPSVLLLVDDESGRVVRRRSLFWWPLVNGKRPAFLRGVAAYQSRRYRVFANVPVRRARAGTASWPPASTAQITGPPNVTNDCLIVLADRNDPMFRGDLRAVERTAASLRLRRANARNARQLRRRIKALRTGPPPCTDIVITIIAHGWAAAGSNFPHPNGGGNIPESDSAQVTLKTAKGKATNFNARQLRQILRENSDVTFKLIVSACFSGRWVDELKDEPNMRIAVAASRADQVSWGYFVNGGHYQIATQRNAVLTTSTRTVENTALNPFMASPFIANVFGGISRWSASTEERRRTGDDLGKGIGAGVRLGAGENTGANLGWQETQLSDHTSDRPHAQPPLKVSCTGGTQFVPNFPRELSYGFNCTSQGDSFDRFVIVFNQGGLNNRIPPSQQGTACQFMTFEIPNDTEACVSPNFGTGMNINGRLAFGADVSCTTTADLIVANGSNDRHVGPFRLQMPFSCQ